MGVVLSADGFSVLVTSPKRSFHPRKDGPTLTGYATLLAELKGRVQTAQLQAVTTVNTELLRLYWQMGSTIARAQDDQGWGAGVIPKLAADLREAFPDAKGFSERNLKYMVRFASEYGAPAIMQPAVAQLAKDASTEKSPAVNSSAMVQPPVAQTTRGTFSISPPLVAKLPWAHHIVLLEKVKNLTDRRWYMEQAIGNGWSRSVLTAQINAKAHRRTGRAISNFATTLPPAQSDLAQQALKDPYVFDFLALGSAWRERDLEQGLTDHIQKFLVALGVGFAFAGRQVQLHVGGQDYYLDLLFYHLKLRCFVVIDLKVEAFKPEFAGKMNFYLSAVDEQMRHASDQPTIGLLLCQENNRLTVEYALRDVKKPIGVAEWKTRLVDSLPKKLQGALPSIAAIEKELSPG